MLSIPRKIHPVQWKSSINDADAFPCLMTAVVSSYDAKVGTTFANDEVVCFRERVQAQLLSSVFETVLPI